MKKKLLSCALCAALPLASAHAELSFNGFANIVAGKASSNDQIQGYDDDLTFKQDSLFAIQATTELGEGLTATAQIMSRGENDWDTEFEWAYLGYQINEDFKVLAGRQRLPLYMYSDFVDVSYAYPWITPPNGVYGIELNRFDGLSGVYNFTLGEFDSTAQFIFGSSDDTFDLGGETINSEFEDIFGGVITLTRDWLTLRAAFFDSTLTIPIDGFAQLADAWQQVPGYEHVSEQLVITEDQSQFLELGFRIDYHNILLSGEFISVENEDTPQADDESWYLTAGYRFDNVLVHVTYGADEANTNDITKNLPTGDNAALNQLTAITRGAVDTLVVDSSYYTVGARWDFHDSAALKVEFTSFDDDQFNQDANLVRTALVTVF